jgi:pantoate--beta-alanine ligase
MKKGLTTVATINELRQAVKSARGRKESIGLVPTMGALHEGHASLIRKAAEECHFIVVSIFVNPMQFRPGEDYQRYPRTPEQDRELAERSGANLIFAPTVEEMYPAVVPASSPPTLTLPHKEGGKESKRNGKESADIATYVEVPGLSDVFEGQARPGHFRGVATVVLKLFNQAQADRAYFGQKDAQQLAVVRQMVRDLNVPIEIVAYPTVREVDGLAMSSRNIYLSPDQRRHATALYRALTDAKERVQAGERDTLIVKAAMAEILDATPGCQREYAQVVNPSTFAVLEHIDGDALAVIAARFGATRLIDNMMLTSGVSTT